MAYLYRRLAEAELHPVPPGVIQGLSPARPLRPYQLEALRYFITYFEGAGERPNRALFHMATGSGKTLIMAGLFLYLYLRGFRDFLFFVSLSNIVEKTRDNFLNRASGKYLFAEDIVLEGRRVAVRQVQNFQAGDPEGINVRFTTVQGLHSELTAVRENGLSPGDFSGRKIALISDEAHHLTVSTRRGDVEAERTWEHTVHRLLAANRDNVLLEFTATCDLRDPRIRDAYADKIVYDYPLKKFRADGYSKEIVTLRGDLSLMDRALQALVLSQYRLWVFRDHRLEIKPVVLFKAAKIADSRAFMAEFARELDTLTGERLARVAERGDSAVMGGVYAYFAGRGVTLNRLAAELRRDFSPAHCISANDDREAEARQLALNTLEERDNPYLAVFQVKKLDEGWDVLNLFDIVRLYETKGPGTISEAQLIGRGARYCPFQVEPGQPRFRRKYDGDEENPLRICEQLHYHCRDDPQYIRELHAALREIGLDPERAPAPRPAEGERGGERPALAWRPEYAVTLGSGYVCRTTVGELAGENYALVHKAMIRYPVLRFDLLRRAFPGLRSTRQFILEYLGDISIVITGGEKRPTPETLYRACCAVFGQIADSYDSPHPG